MESEGQEWRREGHLSVRPPRRGTTRVPYAVAGTPSRALASILMRPSVHEI